MPRTLKRLMGVAFFTALAGVAGISGAAAASDSGWVPDGPHNPVSVQACGTTLTISDQVNEVLRRAIADDAGNTVTAYKGRYIVKVTAGDGRKVVLDNSGPYAVIDKANGDELVPIGAPGLIYPFDEDEAAVFQANGLPRVFYYTKGALTLSFHAGTEKILTKPANPVSICSLLK